MAVTHPGKSDEFVVAIYPELRRIARRLMARERKGHTLQPTALVHEAILRVLGLDPKAIGNAEHFFLLVVGQMRRLLISHARKKQALKRQMEPFPTELRGLRPTAVEQALSVDHLLDRLKAMDPRAYAVVLLRIHGGLSEEEIAGVLRMGRSSVSREWNWARAWMLGELRGG